MAVLVLLLLALVFTVMAPVSEAQAAHKCYHYTCDGKDPVAMNCATSSTYRQEGFTAYYTDGSTNFPIARVELRYSPVCHTWWARTKVYRATYARAGYLQWLYPGGSYKRYSKFYSSYSSPWEDGVSVWTGMQSDHQEARACGYEWKSVDGVFRERVACTRYHYKHLS